MRISFHVIRFVLSILILTSSVYSYAGRKVENFNKSWRFHLGELSEDAASPAYDDSEWRNVRLPHDWAIAGPFNPEENGYAAKLPWRGAGWYRKTFRLDQEDAGKRVYLDFDGVMAFPKIYINGQFAGEWDYGYMSFRVDATPFVNIGEENVIAVKVDTQNQGTRWYPGAGIYRKVTITICEPVHAAHWGLFITTPEVKTESASIQVKAVVENHSDADSSVSILYELFDPQGRLAVQSKQSESIVSNASSEFTQILKILNPQRWDIDDPNLYLAQVTVFDNDKVVDIETSTFGIRTFRFTADDGFHLNGRRVQLYGVNLHHDHGPLGATFYPRAMERQLEIMRDMGCNAIRTSHNPPAPELLDLCDRMGFVVWDEAFDKWDRTAGRVRGEPPLREYGERQIRNFVMRDRNHPSVVTWSIGNEIPNQPWSREGKSAERVAFMSDFVREYDPTRPVTIGCHIPSTADEHILDAVDMTGWNYARRYANYRKNYPDKPILYSESASALSTRGFYALPLPDSKTAFNQEALQVNSYDHNAARWSDLADVEFQLMEDDRFVGGEFVWTGFDYLGEPTPFSREARSSYFGIVDLCGIPKDRFFIYRSYWRPEETTIHILPHWNWPERIGQTVPVYVYTNGDSAELFLNGRSLGKRSKQKTITAPISLAFNKPATIGSGEEEGEDAPPDGNDGSRNTSWVSSRQNPVKWWRVDLGESQHVGFIDILFDQEARNYQYRIEASQNGSDWKVLAEKNDWLGSTQRMTHETNAEARYIQIVFTELNRRAQPGFWEFCVYPERVENPYYAVLDKYRLRWMDVIYEPGELKAVAYKNGQIIGESVMRTAKEPTAIRLTPDRIKLDASGEDMSYILIEALDEDGTLCPLAENKVEFEIEGPADIAGVGNGNPLSYEPFHADSRKLFFGKAMLILRTIDGETGEIRIKAKSDGLKEGEARLVSY